jgi:DNA-binding MarR family transcriptional regulator
MICDEMSTRKPAGTPREKKIKRTDPPVRKGILDQLLGYQIRRAQMRFFAHFSDRLHHHHTTPGQMGLLMMIAANPGISQVALARAIGIERATLGEFVAKFERQHLVERRGAVGDKRSYALHISRHGQEFLDRCIPDVLAHETDFTSHMTASERATLLSLVIKLADGPPAAK